MNESSKTNWDRVNTMGDAGIDTSDIPALGKPFFEKATLRAPRQPVTISVQIDPAVLVWYQAQGEQYEQRISAALRIYAEAHRQ
jgi:uncharacterized protein (DUF4415 family)